MFVPGHSNSTFVLFSDPKIKKVETGKGLVRVLVSIPLAVFSAMGIDNKRTLLPQHTAEGTSSQQIIIKSNRGTKCTSSCPIDLNGAVYV